MNLFLIFALGTGTMLSLPIFLAICVAYYQRQSSMLPLGAHQLVPGQDVIATAECDWDDEESGGSDRVRGATRGSARPRGGRRLMKVYFRTSDWCSHGQPPLMVKLDLEDVCSVAELCARLRDEYCEEMAVGQSGDASALTVEYRDREGATTQVTSKTRVSRIFEGGVLYVTSSAAPTALVSRASSAASRSTRAESRATSSALTLQPMCGGVMPHEDRGLVDLSLASCCGVQTRHGGLMLTSHTSSAQAVELKRHRRLELERLRAAKFRHYFSM